MLFNIWLNQDGLMSLPKTISIDSATLLAMMQSKMSISDFQENTIREEGKLYFWFAHSMVYRELPILFPKNCTDAAIKQRVIRLTDELENAGLLQKCLKAKALKKSYYTFTKLADSLIFKSIKNDIVKNDNIIFDRVDSIKNDRVKSFDSIKNDREAYIPNTLAYNHNSSSSSKISDEISEGAFEENSPKNEEKKEGEKKGVSVKKTLSSKKAKEADPKTRPHLHIPFISTYQDFHASIKGSPIPNTLFSEHVAGLKKLRLLMIELSEKFKNGEASDDYVLLSFKAFLEKSWEVCKNDPKYSAAKFSPKFLAIDPLEILEKIKNNTKNGKSTTHTGERPNPGMQVRNAIIASERTDASVPILTAADFERMAKELA